MQRPPVTDDDRRSVADWLVRWADRVAHVDFAAVRDMFAEDTFAFGSRVEMVRSRDVLEAEQWRAIWPTIEGFRYDLDTLELAISPDRLMATAAVIFRSIGFAKDGTPFDRPGRATAVLLRDGIDAPWLAAHTHVSLTPGTPSRSFGNRPQAE